MKTPKEIAEDIFLDIGTETIAVCVDRVSLMLDISEFMDLASRITLARDNIIEAASLELERMLDEDEAKESEGSEAGDSTDTVDNIISFRMSRKDLDDEDYH